MTSGLTKYQFGLGGVLPNSGSRRYRVWTVEARNIERAVRAFRVAALFPHSYVREPLGERQVSDGVGREFETRSVFTKSAPGATVPVCVIVNVPRSNDRGQKWTSKEWQPLREISPERDEAESQQLPPLLSAVVSKSTGSEGTEIAIAGELVGLNTLPLADIESKQLEIGRRVSEMRAQMEERNRELQAMRDDMNKQLALMQGEMKRRLKEIWAIELFLGSKEYVKCIATGKPAPRGARITVRQRVLCMDEEIAVHQFLNSPESIGEFRLNNVDDFDDWLTNDPKALDLIFPHQKGIVGLKVRRNRYWLEGAHILEQAAEDAANSMTYLLVRNGENIYRLWADVDLFPRMFPRQDEFSEEIARAAKWEHYHGAGAKAQQEKFLAGMIVIQGLIERSELFAPTSPAANVFNFATFDDHFVAIRDDEGHGALTDDSDVLQAWTWPRYRDWLKAKTVAGVRVLIEWSGFELEKRVRMNSVMDWPDRDDAHTLLTGAGDGYYRNAPFRILYLPDDTVPCQGRWGQCWKPRTKRVSFDIYASDTLIPIDFVSWRMLEHLIKDRSQREDYEQFFKPAWRWHRIAKAKATRERPFIDLVMRECGTALDDERERARAERLLRWWRLKVKYHRELGDDEPKALRMICKAFQAGVDYDDDPEKDLTT